MNGLEDRPEYWRAFVNNASPAEMQALRFGTRVAASQSMGSVRNAALRGETIPQASLNLDKLRAVLGDDAAGTLAQRMADEQAKAQTNAALFQGSQTQPREVNRLATAVRGIAPLSMEIGLPSMAFAGGEPNMGAAMVGAALGRRALQYAGQRADLVRNALTADMVSATGPARDAAMNRLYAVAGQQGLPSFVTGAGQGVNLLMNAAGAAGGQTFNPHERPNTLGDAKRLLDLYRR